MNYIYFMFGYVLGFASLGLLINIWLDKHYGPDIEDDKDWRSWR